MKRVIMFDIDPDEGRIVSAYQQANDGLEFELHTRRLTARNVDMLDGFDAVSVLGSPIDAAVTAALKQRGIGILAGRSIGYDNVDLAAARSDGITVTNVVYSKRSVAEFSLMLILMGLRKATAAARRFAIQDFSLPGLDGRELGRQTVGVIGVGRIGGEVARYCHALGARVIGYDPGPAEYLDCVEYVDLPQLLGQADVIAIHANLTEDNHHMIDAAALAAMKPGVALVNCARGELVDTPALADALESGHVGSAGLDVLEGEWGIYFSDCRLRTIADPTWARLRVLPQVTLTQHIAFYTMDVVEEMVTGALANIEAFLAGRAVPNQVTA